jgi:hypothetical protein
VAITIGDELRTYAKEREPVVRGLGKWCSWRIYYSPGHITGIISTYNVGKNKSKHLGMVYQQHLHHIQIAVPHTNPHQLFIDDLLAQLSLWQKAGE